MFQPDLQPTLVGDAVVIRPIKREDWTELFAAGSDPAIWELHPARDRYTESAFSQFFESGIASKTAFVFVDPETRELIGSSRYYGYDAASSEIEIGWTFIVRKHWGGRVNAEAKHLMLKHAFGFVDTVIFWVGEHNLRSLRAVEKIGGVPRDGRYVRELAGAVRHIVFEIRKDRYLL